MKTIQIQIPGMQSAHCQMRVNNAIRAVEGTIINSITPGVADITVQDNTQQQEVLSAIEKPVMRILLRMMQPAMPVRSLSSKPTSIALPVLLK